MSLFPTLWFLGAIVAAWTTYGTQTISNSLAWRIPSFLQGIPAAIQIIGIYFLPESPRWLISKNRDDEARKILVKHHANGDASSALVDLEVKEIQLDVVKERQYKEQGSWSDLYNTAANRRRLGILFTQNPYPSRHHKCDNSNYHQWLFVNLQSCHRALRIFFC
jgi:MFS family permease